MKNEFIFPANIKVGGPYSPAVRSGKTVYCSGQLGTDPVTGELAEGVEAQARQAILNLQSVLNAAELDLCDVVKTTVFLANIADFAAINVVYAEMFGETRPARSCYAVAALPKGGQIEIECIARKG